MVRTSSGTIDPFRSRHAADFGDVLRQTVRIARASGLARLGRVAIDGSKVRVNTSRHKAMSHARMVEAEARSEDEIGQRPPTTLRISCR